MRVLLILRGSDLSWSLTNVSPKPLYFPSLLRSGGFDTFQPCALGTNFHPFSPLNPGLELTLHHLVLLPSNLLWDWRSSLKGSFLSYPALLLFLLSSSFHQFPCSEPFPTLSMGGVTRLSQEGLSLPSLDLGEERVNENPL